MRSKQTALEKANCLTISEIVFGHRFLQMTADIVIRLIITVISIIKRKAIFSKLSNLKYSSPILANSTLDSLHYAYGNAPDSSPRLAANCWQLPFDWQKCRFGDGNDRSSESSLRFGELFGRLRKQ